MYEPSPQTVSSSVLAPPVAARGKSRYVAGQVRKQTQAKGRAGTCLQQRARAMGQKGAAAGAACPRRQNAGVEQLNLFIFLKAQQHSLKVSHITKQQTLEL